MIDSITRFFVSIIMYKTVYRIRPRKLTQAVYKQRQAKILDLEQNKHQLLHRIASVKTPLIYNILTKLHNLKVLFSQDMVVIPITIELKRARKFNISCL